MALSHSFGYSKSTRAKCHAPTSCKGTPLSVGTLRYGLTTKTETGESVEWRHWGCVDAQILAQLARANISDIAGFGGLSKPDQNKIRLAISLQRVDSADIPRSARTTPVARPTISSMPVQSAQSSTASSSLKRKASMAGIASQTASSVAHVRDEPSTQVIDEEEALDELFVVMNSNVVGIRYYTGLVGPQEEVLLVREPGNQYDRNAIQVKNISQIQVGHLPRAVAAKLAPLLDQNKVSVEGVINDGNLSGSRMYQLSINLKIYGPSERRQELEPLLVWATPQQRGFTNYRPPGAPSTNAVPNVSAPTASQKRFQPAQSASQIDALRRQQEAAHRQQQALQRAAELRTMLSTLEKVDDEGRRSSLLDTLCPADDVLSLPVYANPPGIRSGELTVDLLKHQSQALRWCIERENPVLPKLETDKPVQFWQLRKRGSQSYYYNIATKTPQEAVPILGRGALCADAMGLGKTLTMIALILATKNQSDPGFSKSTLIVVPLSVLSNWEKQIADHCVPGVITTCVYYGANKTMSSVELQQYDIVLTTYQTATGEYEEGGGVQKKKRSERSLYQTAWKRIILDEGHNIRNPKTKMAKSVVALNASRRWVLSGTPIINSPRDLGSILTFLRICRPLDNEDFFKRLLLRPLKNGEVAGVELLKALMNHVCIRRTKEMQDKDGKPIIELPPVEMIKIPVALSLEARQLYDQIEEISKQRVEGFLATGHMTTAIHSNVLSMLTRMRQIALHPALVPATYLEDLRLASTPEETTGKVIMTPELKIKLQDRLARAIEECEECPVCLQPLPSEARITPCAHVFCMLCITETLSRDPKCPMDRSQVSLTDLIEPPPPLEMTQVPREQPEDTGSYYGGPSAKIDQLVHLLNLTPTTEKSLVFSQFTSFLDKIAEALQEEGIPFVRFDGQMSARRRQDAIARFSVPLTSQDMDVQPEPTRQSRGTRKGRRQHFEAEDEDDSAAGNDSDFVMDGADSDGDDDYLAEDGPLPTKKSSKGKGKARAVPRQRSDLDADVDSGKNPRVMLLSLKAGALGLNLTVANNVYLMDPWWQEGIESQAVDRVNRIGQQKPVHVYQLIAENTVEAKVLEIQEKKKKIIQQAFSGTKRTETQRQQREARLQDLVELFGVRSAAPRGE